MYACMFRKELFVTTSLLQITDGLYCKTKKKKSRHPAVLLKLF